MKCKRRLMRTAVKGKERMNFYIYYTTGRRKVEDYTEFIDTVHKENALFHLHRALVSAGYEVADISYIEELDVVEVVFKDGHTATAITYGNNARTMLFEIFKQVKELRR